MRIMTEPIRGTSEIDRGNAQTSEAEAKLVRDYIETRQQSPNMPQATQLRGDTANRNELVFSASHDVKLYGAETIAHEKVSRRYDPYATYKEMLRAATREASGTASVRRAQPRSLNVSVAESVWDYGT